MPKCPKCGIDVEVVAKFCGECGTAIPQTKKEKKMSKCPKCGIEVEAGAKFCMECGEPIPQTKECPKCHAQWPLKAKFCGECGYNFNAAATGGGSVIGDKNVIAGDVHIDRSSTVTNNTVNNVTNTTTSNVVNNIINNDETKKVVACVVCGHQLQVTDSSVCKKCGKHACDEHFEADWQMCTNCVKEARDAAEGDFIGALDNKLTYARYQELRRAAHLTDDRIVALLSDKETRRETEGDCLREFLKHSGEAAADTSFLARLYEAEGVGSYTSVKRAVAFYRRAAKLGDRFATERLAAMDAPLSVSGKRYTVRFGYKGVSFGRDVFETPDALFGLTPEEKAKYKDPSVCCEHALLHLMEGNTFTVTPEDKPTKAYEVVVSAIKDQRIRYIAPLREATGLELREAKERLATLPGRAAVLADEAKATALKDALVAKGGVTAEVRETTDFTVKDLPSFGVAITLYNDLDASGVHYRDASGVHYEKIEGEGPWPDVLHDDAAPDRVCLYVARDMVGEIEYSLFTDGDFDPELLDVYWTHYYGEDGISYSFVDHIEYAGEKLWVWHEDELADMGEETHSCYEGAVGFASFDLKAMPRHFHRVRFEYKADWIHYACERADGMDRIARIRRRELTNFEDDYNLEDYALVGSKLRAIDTSTGAILADLTLDPRESGGVVYEKEHGYYDGWLVNFEEHPEAKYLFACKRYASRGLCSVRSVFIEGDFNPSKLTVRWKQICPVGEADNPDELSTDLIGITYNDKSVLYFHQDSPETPSSNWVPIKERGTEIVEKRGSWILDKEGRHKVNLWGDWVDAH